MLSLQAVLTIGVFVILGLIAAMVLYYASRVGRKNDIMHSVEFSNYREEVIRRANWGEPTKIEIKDSDIYWYYKEDYAASNAALHLVVEHTLDEI